MINGHAYEWANLEVYIGETVIHGITAIKYSQEQEKANNYGRGNKPVSRSRGKITFEGSITLEMIEVEALQAIAPGADILNLQFDVLVAYLSNGEVVKHKLLFCEFTNNGRELSQGDSEVQIELNLIIGDIKWSA